MVKLYLILDFYILTSKNFPKHAYFRKNNKKYNEKKKKIFSDPILPMYFHPLNMNISVPSSKNQNISEKSDIFLFFFRKYACLDNFLEVRI